jgi:hypothetical protein
MATPHAPEIVLTDPEREHLEALVRKRTAPQRDVGRARIVLLAADGLTNQQIAARVRCARWTVTTWRQRFAQDRLVGLQDKPRSGRPPVFSPGAAPSDDRPGL